MFARTVGAALIAVLVWSPSMACAQEGITVLDEAQDSAAGQAEEAGEASSPCGNRPVTIARMQWPSSSILAEIHAQLLASHFGCETRLMPGDMATTGSSMATTGQPAVVPELWITRIAEVWNEATQSRTVRPAANTYDSQVFEGWYIPEYVATSHPELTSAASLATAQLAGAGAGKPLFISCPADWGCSIINRNLLAAHALTDTFEVIQPANRLEMDRMIAGAVSRREPFVTYYWQPNAVLDQFGFFPLDMGAYDAEALQCLARADCANPRPSSFASETVVVALAEWVFLDIPQVAAYFQRAVMPLSEMNALLADLNQPGATVESVAGQFIAERADVWRTWVGSGTP